MPFATKLGSARFVYSPLSAEDMMNGANDVMAHVIARIKGGINCEDQAAKPLKPGKNGKPGYPEQKQRSGIAGIRNWISNIPAPRGRTKTLLAMKVKSANENRAIIGFIDPKADRIAHINNRREKQFGLSPEDKKFARTVFIDLIKRRKCLNTVKTWDWRW